MDKFTQLTATACPLEIENLNTDMILPARFLKWPRSRGLGQALLRDLRFDAQDREQADFPLSRPAWCDARIMVGSRNFGCGSSREAAVYALYDYGIRCVIAPSFGDIFSGNAVQNGLLTAVVSEQEAAEIMAALVNAPSMPLTVDLEQQTIICGNKNYPFAIDPVRRLRLLNGWDDLDLTASYRDSIATFKTRDRAVRPWAAVREN
ncbi:MAG TPA: 3-isopropylmalate dehydratase small subunit [Xanthobacteraceae bacterium]|jgi:3-isopropylmalate/(R)-2-methylmalate dehydratase small subunit|nr:3-isopropylmalate dehydratase small subunit [Xanthobacteraceae bacterium]